MNRVMPVSLSLLLVLLIFGNALTSMQVSSASSKVSSVSGKVRELIHDKTRELYIDRIIYSEIPDTQDQKASLNLVCKNLLKDPNSCADIFFFSLVDSSGKHHEAKLAESRMIAARIPTHDIVQGSLVFVIPKAENATQLSYSEPKGSNFIVDLSSTKDPADKPPASEWRLGMNKGLTLSDSRVDLKIYNENRTKDSYVLDISIRNKGTGIVDYNALYAYLKSASGFAYGANIHAVVEPKITSGTLQPGQEVRGKIAFDVEEESGSFMLIYDDIAGSYFATGKFVPIISSEVTGEVVGTPEDLVKINKHNVYTDPTSETYKIIGEVSNDSGNFVTDIQINAILQDQSGNVVSKLNYTLTNFLSSAPVKLAPKASMPFSIELDSAIKNIGSYELSLRYSISEAKKPALMISSAELVQESQPTPLSKYALWQVKGEMVNIGDVRSTHTGIIISVYDVKDSIIGLGGFSTLDQQPREINPGQKKSFSIEITVPVAFKPSSFRLYAESDQFVITEPKIYGKEQSEPKRQEPPPTQNQNHTLINVASKQRGDIMKLVVKNLANSTANIYGIEISVNQTSIHTLKTKLRWDSKEIAGNEVLLSTLNNPIRPGQKAKLLFSVDDDIHLVYWKALDLNGTMLLQGKVKLLKVNIR